MHFKYKERYRQILLRQRLLQQLVQMDRHIRLVMLAVLVKMDKRQENFDVSPVHVRIVVMVKVVIVIRKRSNIYATFLDVIRYMEKHRIYAPIYDGIQAKGHLFAIGFSVENVSLVRMSFNDIVVHIQVN